LGRALPADPYLPSSRTDRIDYSEGLERAAPFGSFAKAALLLPMGAPRTRLNSTWCVRMRGNGWKTNRPKVGRLLPQKRSIGAGYAAPMPPRRGGPQ